MLGSRAKRRWFKVRTEEETIGEFTDAAGAARLGTAASLRAVTAGRRAETDVAVLDANRLHTVDRRRVRRAWPLPIPAALGTTVRRGEPARWLVLSHTRQDTAARHTRRLAMLHCRRCDPGSDRVAMSAQPPGHSAPGSPAGVMR